MTLTGNCRAFITDRQFIKSIISKFAHTPMLSVSGIFSFQNLLHHYLYIVSRYDSSDIFFKSNARVGKNRVLISFAAAICRKILFMERRKTWRASSE